LRSQPCQDFSDRLQYADCYT